MTLANDSALNGVKHMRSTSTTVMNIVNCHEISANSANSAVVLVRTARGARLHRECRPDYKTSVDCLY